MKRKSIVSLLLVFVLIASLTLTACQSNNEPKGGETTNAGTTENQGSTSETAGKPVHLTFATQEVGTGAYQYASALNTIFIQALPEGSNVDLTTESPGGVGAPIIIENKQADIIMSNAGPAKWSAEEGILDNPPTKNVRAIAGGLGHDFVNILFTKDFVDKTGIKSIEEIVEKQYPVRVAVKKVGTLGYLAFVKLFEAFDVSIKDIESWGGQVNLLAGDNIKTYLQDGMADITVDHVAAGQANTTELCMTTAMYFPQLSDSTLGKLADMGFAPITIEPDTWKGQTSAIKSVGSQQVILVTADMEDYVAYALAKGLVESKDELSAQIAALSHFDPLEAWKPGYVGAEIHPGAKKYFEEAGFLK